MLAAVLLFWSTRLGPGLSPDSLHYLILAQSVSRGEGFHFLGEAMTHFPPGYPVLLAAVGATSAETLTRARVLHAVLFGLNAVLVAAVARRAAGGSAWIAPLALLVFVSSPAVLTLHAMAWSEAAFLACLLAASLLLSRRLAGGPRGVLLAAAGCLAAALLTRYAGLAFVPPVLLALVCWRGRALAVRLGDAALALLIGVGPLAAWLLRNAVVGGSATDRTLAFHPFGGDHVKELARTAAAFWGFGEPTAWAVVSLLPLGAALVLGLPQVRALLRGRWGLPPAAEADALQGFAVAAAASYAAFLVLSISFVDVDTPVDVRMLAPLHVLVVALAAACPGVLLLKGRPRAARAVAAALLVIAGLNLPRAVAEAARLRREGEGFETAYWRNSATLAALRALPPETPVFSNGPEVVAFYAHPNAADVPAWSARVSLRPRPEYPSELAGLCTAVARGALVVYLDGITWRWEVPTLDDLRAACPLRLAAQFEDGALYRSAGNK